MQARTCLCTYASACLYTHLYARVCECSHVFVCACLYVCCSYSHLINKE